MKCKSKHDRVKKMMYGGKFKKMENGGKVEIEIEVGKEEEDEKGKGTAGVQKSPSYPTNAEQRRKGAMAKLKKTQPKRYMAVIKKKS